MKWMFPFAWIVGIGCLVAMAISIGRHTDPSASPWSGSRAHDFGVVNVSAGPVTARHRFALTNGSSLPVEIVAVHSTCGCLAADVSGQRIEPGGVLIIDAALLVDTSGPAAQSVRIATDRGTPLTLSLMATGHMARILTAVPHHLRLDQDGRGRVTIIVVDHERDSEPAPLLIDSPSWLDVRISGWTQVQARDATVLRPARWHGAIEFQADSSRQELFDQIEVACADQCAVLTVSPGVPSSGDVESR